MTMSSRWHRQKTESRNAKLGRARSISFSPASASPSDWGTFGGSRICATRMAEVIILRNTLVSIPGSDFSFY